MMPTEGSRGSARRDDYEPMLLRLAEDAVIGDMLSDEGIRTHSEIFDVVPSSRRYSIHSIAFPYRPRTNISYLVV